MPSVKNQDKRDMDGIMEMFNRIRQNAIVIFFSKEAKIVQ